LGGSQSATSHYRQPLPSQRGITAAIRFADRQRGEKARQDTRSMFEVSFVGGEGIPQCVDEGAFGRAACIADHIDMNAIEPPRVGGPDCGHRLGAVCCAARW
jgi:hypothetical protein